MIGYAIFLFSAIPASLNGALLGAKHGAGSATAVITYHLLLLIYSGEYSSIFTGGFVGGSIVIVFLGWLAGKLRNLNDRLEEELTKRRKAERELKESKERIEDLHTITTELESAKTREEVFQIALRISKTILDLDGCYFDLVEDGKSVVEKYSLGVDKGAIGGIPDSESSRTINLSSDMKIKIASRKGSEIREEDIKLMKLLVLHLTEALERLESKERAEFLHSLLRHDLGNQLQITRGFLELLHEDLDLSEEYAGYLEDSLNSLDEGMELIENVRTLNKIESKEKGVEKKPVELKTLINESVGRYDDLRKDLGFEINNDVEDEVEVVGGPIMKELFTNLIENSLKHSEGSKIEISLKKKEEEVKMMVEDDGKGIPDGIKEKVTEKGFQGEGSSGSGLGMHLVKNIAETYGGGFKIKDSESGGGKI